MTDRIPVTTGIKPANDRDVLERDRGLLWRVEFTKRFSEKQSSSSIELMSQGELLTLWQQIGVLFNLEGMRNGLSEEDIKKLGVTRK